jgi:hypothetical protein
MFSFSDQNCFREISCFIYWSLKDEKYEILINPSFKMLLLMKTVGNRQLRTLNFPFKAKKKKEK